MSVAGYEYRSIPTVEYKTPGQEPGADPGIYFGGAKPKSPIES